MNEDDEKTPGVSRTPGFSTMVGYCNSCVNAKATVSIRVRRTYTALCDDCAINVRDGLLAALPVKRVRPFKNLNVHGAYCHGAQTQWCKEEKSRCDDCPLRGKGDLVWPG